MESFHIHRGFTLIELMVVLTIITVLMGIVLSSQSTFNKTLILSNTAYDIALTLRSAETFGLSSRGSIVSTSAGYGLHFLSGSSGLFTLFSDIYPSIGGSPLCHTPPVNDPIGPDAKPGNCVYDGTSEKISDYLLGNGITVYDFCAYTLGSPSCVRAHGGGLLSLDIVFTRPNPNPFISANGSYSTVSPVTAACLTITSSQGGFRYISIAASGQIVVSATPCI